MKQNTWLPVLLMVSALIGCGSDSPPPDDPNNPNNPNNPLPPPANHNEALQRLGVTTDLGPINGIDGKPVAEGYNPLNRKRRPLRPLYEIYMAGAAAPTGVREMLRDDATEGYGIIDMKNTDDAWASFPKVSTHGDFDGDGREEIALVILNNDKTSPDYKKLFLRVIEDKAEAWAVKEKPIATLTDDDLSELEAYFTFYYLKLDIAAGDIDGDGKDEIAVTCVSDLWVLDDRDAQDSYGIILSKKFAPAAGTMSQYLRVAAGDTDGDGKAEMVVADSQQADASSGTVQYHIFDELVETTSGQVKTESTEASELMTADVAIGDVDADKLGEIVFSGRQSGAQNLHKVLVMDDAQAGYVFLKVLYKYQPTYAVELPLHRVETGDFDGDNAAEIVSYTEVLDDLSSHQGLVKVATLPNEPAFGTALAVGDVTNDLKEEIVYLRGTDPNAMLVVYGTVSGNNYGQLNAIDVADNPLYPTITTVNTDDDSPIIEFQGHEIRFTDPRILAVMAAPPSHKNIPTDNVLSGTAFGKSSSTTVEKERSLGFSIGWSSEVEAHFIAVSGSISTSIEAAFDLTTTKSKTIESAYSFTGTADSDKVVFTAVPFDLYYYKVLSSPKPEEVGMHLVVNIPRQPQLLFVDRKFFNDNNGSFPDIDSTVLGHTIGDPRSYPHEAGVDKAGLVKSGGFYSVKMTVGQGMGFQTASINSSDGESFGLKFDLSTKVGIQGGADVDLALIQASAKGGPEFGFHFGFGYTISSAQTTYYAGSVGNIINGDDWTNNRFDFGLFVQPTTFQGQKFPVINYWVD